MVLSIRRIVNLILFTLLAPLIGYEEAARDIAKGQREIDREFITSIYTSRKRRKGIENELIEAAKNYEISGIDNRAYFEYMLLRLTLYVEDLRRRLGEYYVAILTLCIGLSLLSLIIVLILHNVLILGLTIVSIGCIIFLLHLFQIKLAEYNYMKPLLAGFLASSISMILALCIFNVWDICKIMSISIISFSSIFSVLYIPQFLKFMRFLLYIRTRLIRPFYELLWNPVPRFFRTELLIEREFYRVFEKGKQIGAPWFIARVNKLVELFVDFIVFSVRQGILYSLFIPVGFLTLLFIVRMLLNVVCSVSPPGVILGSIVLLPDVHTLRLFLIVYSYVTGLVTGKMMHSVGLGVLIGLILLIITLVILT